jgi:putative tryptophan/tyrosine transport system substrate-binding protein
MFEMVGTSKMRLIVRMISFSVLCMVSGGCDRSSTKPFTIGILSYVSIHAPVIEGVKTGMAEQGYVDGKDVRYIYHGILENNDKVIDAEIKRLLAQDVDMLLPVGNEVSLRVKKAVEGADVPVLFSACNDIVEIGLVQSLTRPGGNITGVINMDSTPKALECLKKVLPGFKKVYVPFNPDDEVSIICLPGLKQTASNIGVEVVYLKVHSVEEAISAIGVLPKDGSSILRIPSPTLDARNSEISRAAINKGLPLVSRLPLDKDVFITYGSDFFQIGRQAARLAHQIRQGVRPKDLPVESAEFFLTINVGTAAKIGIDVPDSVLFQAKTIIR